MRLSRYTIPTIGQTTGGRIVPSGMSTNAWSFVDKLSTKDPTQRILGTMLPVFPIGQVATLIIYTMPPDQQAMNLYDEAMQRKPGGDRRSDSFKDSIRNPEYGSRAAG